MNSSTSDIRKKLEALEEQRRQLDEWYFQYSIRSLSCDSNVNIGMTSPLVLPTGIASIAACIIATQKLLAILEIVSPPKEVYAGALGCGLALTVLCTWFLGDRISKGYHDLDNSIKQAKEELEISERQPTTSRRPH